MTQLAVSATADSRRWPDVARTPHAPVRARIASAVVSRAARRMPFRVEVTDPSWGVTPEVLDIDRHGSTQLPVLRIRRAAEFFARLGSDGLIGFGEAYQSGAWDSDDLTALLSVFAAAPDTIIPTSLRWLRQLYVARMPHTADNSPDNAKANIEQHYDLSNELFASFLDDTMTYSSALFPTALIHGASPRIEHLAAAQHRKIDRLLDLAGVGPGTRLLEIGTGWGELALRAAARGASVLTVTLSARQREFSTARLAAAGPDIADRVRVELLDYRDIAGSARFDAIVSVEMVEAVGHRYWSTYFAALDRLLANGGKVAIQAITMADKRLMATRDTYTWIQKYIFPGGLIPSIPAIRRVLAAHTTLRVTDDLRFGEHYAHTLRLWRQRFANNLDSVRQLGFDETFRRTWELYLAYSEAGFATGYLDVHQLLLERA